MAGPLLALACCGIMFINAGVVFSLGLFLPDLCISLNASKFEVSIAAAMQHSLCLGTGVFGGHLVELYGCHRVSAVASLAVALGLLLSMFTTHIIYFYLTYSVLAGIGLGFQYVPTLVAVAQGYSMRYRAAAMAVVQSGAGLGPLALAPLIQMAIEEYSWRGAYLLLAGFSLNAVPFAWAMRPTTISTNDNAKDSKDEPDLPFSVCASMERRQDSINYGCQGYHSHSSPHDYAGSSHFDANSGKVSKYSTNRSMRDSAVSVMHEIQPTKHRFVDKLKEMFDFSFILHGRFFWPLLGDVIFNLAIFAPIPLISPRAILLGVSPFRAALLMSIYGALNVVGRFVMGIAAMLFGSITTMLVLSICLAVTCSLAPFYTTYPMMALMTVLYGLLAGGMLTVESLIAGETVEVERVHKAIGLQYSIDAVAVAISYPLAAAVWESTDCMEAPFYLLAVCSGLMTISLSVWHVRYKPHCKLEDNTDNGQDGGVDEDA